jgi:hypothetical protein
VTSVHLRGRPRRLRRGTLRASGSERALSRAKGGDEAMSSTAEKVRDVSLVESVIDVIEAGQRVLLDRIELLSLEARAMASNAVASLGFLLAGLGLLLVGWLAVNVCVVLTLGPLWSYARATALVAGIDVALGVTALVLARRRAAPRSVPGTADAPAPVRA